MKRLIMVLIAGAILALLPNILLAENSTAENRMKIVGEIGMDFFSRYVGGTSGGIAYNKPVIQGNVKFTLEPLGLYFKSWGSGILSADGNKYGGNEIDPVIIGIARPIWKFKVDFGYAYYDLHPQFRRRGDLHGFFGTISYPNKFLEPYHNGRVRYSDR